MAVDEEKVILTRAGYEHLQQELASLEATEREERALLADSLNDSIGRDDNADAGAEFDARTRKEWTDEQIAHLHYVLERAEIYEDPDPARVNTGERVTLWDLVEKEETQFDLLSSVEVTSQANVGPGVRDISDASPIGQALLGKAVGDVIEVDIPDGKVRYTIRKIDRIPEANAGD